MWWLSAAAFALVPLPTCPARIGLLPWSLEDTLLPGESRSSFFFEERFRACLADARRSSGYVASLLFADTGDTGDPAQFAVVEASTLLRVEEVKADDVGVYARLTCVARCKLTDIETSPTGYSLASAQLFADDADDIAATVAGQPSLTGLRTVHATVAAQRRKLVELLLVAGFDGDDDDDGSAGGLIYVGEDKRSSPFGVFEAPDDDDDDDYMDEFDLDDDELDEDDFVISTTFLEEGDEDEYVFIGQPWERPQSFGTAFFNCRDPGELDDEESGKDLDELIAARRALLCGGDSSSGAGGGSSDLSSDGSSSGGTGDGDGEVSSGGGSGTLSDAIGSLWGEGLSEDALELELLSWAASAMLDPLARAEAMMISDLSGRLEHALAQLSAQEEDLAKLLRRAEASVPGNQR